MTDFAPLMPKGDSYLIDDSDENKQAKVQNSMP